MRNCFWLYLLENLNNFDLTTQWCVFPIKGSPQEVVLGWWHSTVISFQLQMQHATWQCNPAWSSSFCTLCPGMNKRKGKEQRLTLPLSSGLHLHLLNWEMTYCKVSEKCGDIDGCLANVIKFMCLLMRKNVE